MTAAMLMWTLLPSCCSVVLPSPCHQSLVWTCQNRGRLPATWWRRPLPRGCPLASQLFRVSWQCQIYRLFIDLLVRDTMRKWNNLTEQIRANPSFYTFTTFLIIFLGRPDFSRITHTFARQRILLTCYFKQDLYVSLEHVAVNLSGKFFNWYFSLNCVSFLDVEISKWVRTWFKFTLYFLCNPAQAKEWK